MGKDSCDKKIVINKELDYKVDINDFRQRKKDKLSLNRVWRDIKKCQHACEQLDKDKACDKNITHDCHEYLYKQGYEPESFWYWASTDGDGEEDEEEDYEVNKFYCIFTKLLLFMSSLKPEDTLNAINDYLRSTHHYCIWCGVAFTGLLNYFLHGLSIYLSTSRCI